VKEQQKPPKPAELSEAGQRGGFERASFDVPRSVSPWGGLKESGTSTPRTPGSSRRRAESPPKLIHKRPSSMVIHSSPQLTPTVLVESPKSPPKGYFFDRSGSRSPERAVDNTPFAKVRELISQHSSRASTRPGTPHADIGDRTNTDNTQNVNGPDHAKLSAIPPPVNRAEKPKIPAKPTIFTVQDITSVANQARRPSHDVRISPFNTPPSSDEEPSQDPANVPASSTHNKSDFKPPQPTARRLSPQRNQTQLVREPQPIRPNDPRFMGFSKPADVIERKDSRAVGFDPASSRSPSRDPPPSPARAKTVSERPLPRDSREFALGPSKLTPRQVSENTRQIPPPVLPPATSTSPRQVPIRDPRLLGFSGSATIAHHEPSPGLPPRRTGTEPPRPPDESKRPATRPITQPLHSIPVDRSTKPATRTPQTESMSTPPDSNILFPPPPKRSAALSDPAPPSIQPTRSGPIPATKISILDKPQVPHRAVSAQDSDEDEAADEPFATRTEYPDMSQANRLSPFFTNGLQELPTKSDARVFDSCGQYLCTASYVTRVFDLSSGEQIMSLNHGETVKVTSVAFRPAAEFKDEGSRIWIGNNIGEIHEIDVMTHTVVASNTSHNRREIVRILRCRKDLWTLDDEGKLFIWPAHESGMPSLKYSHLSHRVQKGHTFSMVVRDKLWLATGKEIRIYKPGNEATFAALMGPQSQSGTGDITSGTYSAQQGGRVYFGHTDGKVTIYSTKDYTCLGIIKASDYKINALAFVGDWLWAAYKTGKIYVYDTSSTPWKVKKDWRAHESPIAGMLLDPSSFQTLRRLQVVSMGHDNLVRLWDGMLEDDWLENAMHERNIEYCTFREVRVAIMTWNVGAISPFDLRSGDFIADAIHAEDPPEILAFGFQEVVDLEDRAVTAKSILGFGKKKDNVKTEQHQSRIYREWRDYLSKCINNFTAGRYTYSELHTSSLVGLFQCIFVRQEERQHIRNLCATDVKCGLKGHYGNKGALITRFILDDSSLCFINCHLAAGQTHTSQRNNDVATILEAEFLPAEHDPDVRSSLFVGGGDGSQILDHEICLLNGDLNYRIDTIPRDTVINMIKRNELAKLLERDQIMVSRRRVSGFRLSPFTELPITFAPTYKYDTGTDNYDSSEKKRAPAWCDRLLYRGPGRVKQTEYRRHEVRVSDHRPVSGLFKITVKTIDEVKREKTKDRCHKAFGEVQRRLAADACVEYLVNSLGLGEKEAKALIAGG
jgi:hypothetical protein